MVNIYSDLHLLGKRNLSHLILDFLSSALALEVQLLSQEQMRQAFKVIIPFEGNCIMIS